MFVHITVNTFTGREWGDGTESPSLFAPSRLDTRQWARTAREAGFGSMILTAKHHDGFCLWPTRTTRHSVASSPWRNGKGDLVREFADACREEGLGVGLYVSPWDRNAPVYGQGTAYDDFYIEQLTELLSGYGELVEVWFDGANGEGPNGRRQAYDWPRIHAKVRELQPRAVMFGDNGPDVRWIGNEHGEAGTTCWSSVAPERVPEPGFSAPWVRQALMQGDPGGSVWRPGESDVSIRPGWFWHAREDDRVRSGRDLMELYFNSVGRNSKLLLNVPSTDEGRFHDRDVAALRDFAQARRELFSRDLLSGAHVRASSERAGHPAQALLDGSDDTFWMPQEDDRMPWVEFQLPQPIEFDVSRIGEAIAHGQHVANHRIDAWLGGGWHTVAWGTTIGNARMDRFAPVRTNRVRVVVEFGWQVPRLSSARLYRTPSEWMARDPRLGH